MSSSMSTFSICNLPLTFRNTGSNFKPNVVAMAIPGKAANEAPNRDSLDHLQRLGQSPSQPQLRNRTVPNQVAAPVVIWDRVPAARTVQQMMDTMERLIDDPINNWGSQERNRQQRERTQWAIRESQGSYKIRFDIPGMNKNDVRVWIEENMLVVKAQKLGKKEGEAEIVSDEEDDWPAESYGKYHRRIALPETVELEKIQAEVRDGVLYVTIPKARAAAKKIDISVQ